MSEPIWTPDPATVGDTNVGQFMAAHGIGTVPELLTRSIEDPAWFWGETAAFLGIPFSTPYEQVLDTSDGMFWWNFNTGLGWDATGTFYRHVNLGEYWSSTWRRKSGCNARPAQRASTSQVLARCPKARSLISQSLMRSASETPGAQSQCRP